MVQSVKIMDQHKIVIWHLPKVNISYGIANSSANGFLAFIVESFTWICQLLSVFSMCEALIWFLSPWKGASINNNLLAIASNKEVQRLLSGQS